MKRCDQHKDNIPPISYSYSAYLSHVDEPLAVQP